MSEAEVARSILSDEVITPELLERAGLGCFSANPLAGGGLRVGRLGDPVVERELRYIACYRSVKGGRKANGDFQHYPIGVAELRDFIADMGPFGSLRDPGERVLRSWRAYDAYWAAKQGLKGSPGFLRELSERAEDAGVDFRSLSEEAVGERVSRLVEAARALSRYDGEGILPGDPFSTDLWRVDVISDVCGIRFNESLSPCQINFLRISDLGYRDLAKEFIRSRITGGREIALSTASRHATVLTAFLNRVSATVPGGLPAVRRRDVEGFFAPLDQAGQHPPGSTLDTAVGCVKGFIEWLQQREDPSAPATPSNVLILRSDYSQRRGDRGTRGAKETPRHVLESLAAHWDELDEDMRCLLSILNKTGLRISDALQLDRSCLALEPDGWWIVCDIEKVPAEQHRVPIDEELAEEVRRFAARPECASEEANPRRFLFVNPDARRRGGPWLQDEMRGRLNDVLGQLGVRVGDGDAGGGLFKFHGMRHRYGMGLLNAGVDIRDVQELLGHRSAAMTGVYAHLTEERKVAVFREAVEKGVFSFAEGGVERTLRGCDVSEELMEALWSNAKLMARDTPFGVCAARKGKLCPNASDPPCLTIAGGRPCPHLSVGLSELDVAKYEVYEAAAAEMEEIGLRYGNRAMAEASAAERARYSEMLGSLREGAVIVGAELLFPEPPSDSTTLP